ncbi:MAG: alkaline phosphatase family protein [Sphingobacteriaceae bacterium]|nr:alkaline phosphatase family protein [Sphingobacteriaceae bacterium]
MKLKSLSLFAFSLLITIQSFGQKEVNSETQNAPKNINRPKLVVGLVIDQMRWDYLYRFYNRYGNGGFKRLMSEGFSAENTFIPYTPTYTACGHASIYTGSVPAINGIIGNDWYDNTLEKNMYCTEDNTVKSIGSKSTAGLMSPKNLLTTTITDELRLASNFKSKVIGISIKDRGAILPAGHTANAAYWYDEGSWITSSYYMNELPSWVKDFNNERNVDKFYAKNWETLYPIETYTESSADDKKYEGLSKGEDKPIFPHYLSQNIDKNYGAIKSTPYGNTLTLDFAKKAISTEKMGQNNQTDFLAISCSSTDYVGHQYGPNSIEIEDTYLRLDKDLEDFLSYLDSQVGKGNYLFFLSADHAVAHVPEFMTENKLPAGKINDSKIAKNLNKLIEDKFKVNNAVVNVMNNQVYFDTEVIETANADFSSIKKTTINYLRKQEGILDAVDLSAVNSSTIPDEIKKRVTNGYNARRSGDIYFILNSNWFDGGKTGTTHGAWYAYDAHIPLLFMGWNVKPGKTNKNYYMSDIAATLAAMLHIQMPSGSVGEPITELTH